MKIYKTPTPEEINEAAEKQSIEVHKTGESYDFWAKNGMSFRKNGDTYVAFRHGFHKAISWLQNYQTQQRGGGYECGGE